MMKKHLLKESIASPVWLCRLSTAKNKGILVCIDDSEAALRMADHVGYILNKETSQNVTLFAVDQNGNNAQKLLTTAKEYLLKNNFPNELIKTVSTKDKNIGKAILKEVKKGKYAAVAVGRRKREPKLIKNMFFGSVSTYLFENLEGTALWICN